MVDVITVVNGAISFMTVKIKEMIKIIIKYEKIFKRRRNNFKRKYNKL